VVSLLALVSESQQCSPGHDTTPRISGRELAVPFISGTKEDSTPAKINQEVTF
jgi:hypothetical protein